MIISLHKLLLLHQFNLITYSFIYCVLIIENADFSCDRQSFTLSPDVPKITVRFDISDDSQPEEREFFTASISTEDEFVKLSVPTTKIFINDNDGEPIL